MVCAAGLTPTVVVYANAVVPSNIWGGGMLMVTFTVDGLPATTRPVMGSIALTMTLVGAAFTIWLRYVEQAYLDGHVCMWCVMFMIAWWFAGAFELRRQLVPAAALATS